MISIGIDVSKGKSTICFLKPYGELIHKPYEVQHTESDLKYLVKQITTLSEECRVIVEATGIPSSYFKLFTRTRYFCCSY